MVNIINTITNFLNTMLVINFDNVNTNLPLSFIDLYKSYVPVFINYFAVFLLIIGFYKFFKFVFSIGGYNK